MKKKLVAMLTLCCMLSGAGCDFSALLGGGGTASSSDEITSEVTEGGLQYPGGGYPLSR